MGEDDSEISFIDDDATEDENDASFYRRVNQQISESVQTAPTIKIEDAMTVELREKQLTRLKKIENKLESYISQIPVISFNGSKYDLVLIKKYLPASLVKFDTLPKFVIKKGRAYLCIASRNLKFLDLCHFVAAGTSLDSLYKSYKVSSEKSLFPYEWFTSLDKLKATEFPPRVAFFSLLKRSIISEAEYQECLDVLMSTKI